MNRKTHVILCNYIKGGTGKTTLAVHIAGILVEQTIKQVLLIDCDPRPDSWRFFSGSLPDHNKTRLSPKNGLDLWWNPPQPKGNRFKDIVKEDYKFYGYIVIDTDSPPEDCFTILSNALPDIFLVPIAESQSHAIQDISPFLRDLEREVRFQRDSGINYNPIVKIVPLGLSIEEIEAELDIRVFSEFEIKICTPMKSLGPQIQKSLKERKFIWTYQNLEYTKTYFINLIQDKITEVQ